MTLNLRLFKLNHFRLQASEPDYVAKLEEDCQVKRSMFVASLKETITEDELVQYFSAFGKVVRAVKIQVRNSQYKYLAN